MTFESRFPAYTVAYWFLSYRDGIIAILLYNYYYDPAKNGILSIAATKCTNATQKYQSSRAVLLLLLFAHSSLIPEALLAGQALVIGPINAIPEGASPFDIHVLRLALDTVVLLVLDASLDFAHSSLKSVVIQAVDAPSPLVPQAALLNLFTGPVGLKIEPALASHATVVI